MSTVSDSPPRSNFDCHQRWQRIRCAELLKGYRAWQAQGFSQRQSAKRLEVPRTTLQAWCAWQARLDTCPQVVEFFESVPGLAFLHRVILALHVVCIEIGAGGIRLVWLFLQMTGFHRFVGASSGTQQRINLRVEEAIGAYRREETGRLARDMAPQAITVTQDATLTGGLCLVAIEPVSNYILLEEPAEARDHDACNAWREHALAPLKCHIIPSTSDEAPGLLAYVAQHLGAHHSPDLFHGQPELSKAVAVSRAAKQRAAAKAVRMAEETLHRRKRTPRGTTRSLNGAALAALRRRHPVWSKPSRRSKPLAKRPNASLSSASRCPRAYVPSAMPTTLSIWSGACVAMVS